jgi:hypothetical protein
MENIKMKTAMMIALVGIMGSYQLNASTWIQNYKPASCTRDVNDWGNPSVCLCPETAEYVERIGECVTNQVTLQGEIKTGIYAIGGETTGVILKTEKGVFELVLSRNQVAEIEENDDMLYEVSGIVYIKQGVERGARRILVVDQLTGL